MAVHSSPLNNAFEINTVCTLKREDSARIFPLDVRTSRLRNVCITVDVYWSRSARRSNYLPAISCHSLNARRLSTVDCKTKDIAMIGSSIAQRPMQLALLSLKMSVWHTNSASGHQLIHSHARIAMTVQASIRKSACSTPVYALGHLKPSALLSQAEKIFSRKF